MLHVYQFYWEQKHVNCQNIVLILVFKGLEVNQKYCQSLHHHHSSSRRYHTVRVQPSHYSSVIERDYDFSRYGVRYCTAVEYFLLTAATRFEVVFNLKSN